jgi:diguanylate cyclase (GGDEF)-like protein/PAS domain S-box-containing protein
MKDTDPATATVMVVDDAPDNLELLNSVLSQQGYRVLEFPCAELALQAVAQAPPDLILLDIMMPDMDGFAMCQRLKADARLQAIPVLFISALNDLDHKLRGFAEGGVDYVTKPFQKEEVVARVATQLELYRVQRELQQHRQHLQTLVEQRTADLHAERLRLRHALEAVQAGTWEWLIDDEVIMGDERWMQMLGDAPQPDTPMTLATWQARLHPEDAERVQQAIACQLSGTDARYEVEFRIRHRQGHWVWLHSLGRVIERSAEGKPVRIAGIMLDITACKRLTQMARKDTLTQIPNRGYFIELAERERQKAQRYHTPLSLLLLDVDHFKFINDRNGHAVGDRALVAFTDACQQVLRDMDIFGRWGGDEFVVLLPDGHDTAYGVAKRMHLAVQQVEVTDDEGQCFGLQTTIGFTSFDTWELTVPTLEQLLARADQALYAAKQAGRNQIKGQAI